MSLLSGALALGLAGFAALPTSAAERGVEVQSFAVRPEDVSAFNKLGGYRWPEVTELIAEVRLRVSGVVGEEVVSVFLAVSDEAGAVTAKFKQKHPLPAGEHIVIIPAVLNVADYYGEQGVSLDLELSLRNAPVVREHLGIRVSGPPPPAVAFPRLRLYNPEGGYRDRHFVPGDAFAVDAVIEISENEAGRLPRLAVVGVMDEEYSQDQPFDDFTPDDLQWSEYTLPYETGLVQTRLYGWLPRYFAEPYDYEHPFRIYVIVDFGRGARMVEVLRGTLYDYATGDHRRSDTLRDRLIEVDRGYRWELDRPRYEWEDDGGYRD